MTVHTIPGYGVAYADVDTPVVELAAVSKVTAQALHDALVRGGIAPPAAQDLAAAVARIATLESGWLIAPIGPRSPTLLNGWSHLTVASWDTVKLDRSAQGRVHLAGDLLAPSAFAAGATTIVANLPANYRPRKNAIRSATIGGATQPRCRLEVRANGDVALIAPTGGIPNGEYVELDCAWWVAAVQPNDNAPAAT
jgi:hypothetical protein